MRTGSLDCAPSPTEGASVRQLIVAGAARLERSGVLHARHEAEWVLEHLLGLRGPQLYLSQGPVDATRHRIFWETLEQRAQGAPLQYVLGETEFYGVSLAVGPGVFIPRPETERVVESALEVLRQAAGRPLHLLDAGTGSGAIAIALARQLETCVVVGVELSWDALHLARRNIQRHKLMDRVRLIQGDWLQPVCGPFDALVCNPPYIASGELERLPADVRREPRASLDGGADGLGALRELVASAPRVLAPGGWLVMECGETQLEALCRLVEIGGWAHPSRVVRDLAGRPRGLVVRRRSR